MPIKVGIVVAALMFLFNVTMTVLKGRKTAVTNILLFGLWGVAIFFLFAFYNPANLARRQVYWWYVVHLWVEGVWELIMASVLAFLMIKLNGIDREVVEKWLYVIIGWRCSPAFSAPATTITGSARPATGSGSARSSPRWRSPVLHHDVLRLQDDVEGRPRPSQQGGAAVVPRLLGDGVLRRRRLGLPAHAARVNYYTHGTQITAAHGHLAFFGAYVMLNLAMMAYAMPDPEGPRPLQPVLNMASFWLMCGGMAFMTCPLTFAGAVQVHLQRVLGRLHGRAGPARHLLRDAASAAASRWCLGAHVAVRPLPVAGCPRPLQPAEASGRRSAASVPCGVTSDA